MKISKSKRQLAQLLIEAGVKQFPEGANWAAQDKSHGARSKNIGFYRRLPVKPDAGGASWRTGKHDDNGIVGEWIEPDVLIPNWHQTALCRDEFDQIVAEIVADADGWIEWRGGECPVRGDVCVKFRSGAIQGDGMNAHRFYWEHDGDISDIIAYRLHKPEQAKTELRRSVVQPITEPEIQSEIMGIAQVGDINVVESKSTIEQLAADYRAKLAIATQAKEEADSHRCGAEVALSKLEIAAKELGFKIEPIAAKQEPELVITDWRDLRVGDEVEASYMDIERFTGNVIKLDIVDKNQPICVSDGIKFVWATDWKFIRRP